MLIPVEVENKGIFEEKTTFDLFATFTSSRSTPQTIWTNISAKSSIDQIKLKFSALKDRCDKWWRAWQIPVSDALQLFWLNHLGQTEVGQKIIVGQNVLWEQNNLDVYVCTGAWMCFICHHWSVRACECVCMRECVLCTYTELWL